MRNTPGQNERQKATRGPFRPARLTARGLLVHFRRLLSHVGLMSLFEWSIGPIDRPAGPGPFHLCGSHGSLDWLDMLRGIFLPEPSCRYLRVKTDRLPNSKGWYLPLRGHSINVLNRDTEDPSNITHSKCLVFSFNHFNQFHEYPLCLLSGRKNRARTYSIRLIVDRTENSVKRHRLLSIAPSYAQAM